MRADSTNPKTWAGYGEAVAACQEHGLDGIGFVVTPEEDLCGVDLDRCLDPETGELEGWAREVIDELDSYAEISPSGRGVHVLVRGTLPSGRNRKGRFEAYDRGRYFTVTGRHLPGTRKTIEGRQELLERVVKRMFGATESKNGHKPNGSAPANNGLTDDEVIQKALPHPTGRGSPACGQETRVVTAATPRRIWPCAGCWRSGPPATLPA